MKDLKMNLHEKAKLLSYSDFAINLKINEINTSLSRSIQKMEEVMLIEKNSKDLFNN